MFLRRLTSNGGSQAGRCAGGRSCPDILELNSGDFAIIGADITSEAVDKLPPECGCGPGERVVRIPRATLVGARANIPAAI